MKDMSICPYCEKEMHLGSIYETDKNTRDFSHEMNCQLCQLFTIISQNSLNIYQHMSIYIVGR